MTHPGEEDLILYYYGDADDPRPIEEHLASCEACRNALEVLRRVLGAVSDAPVPERSDAYGSAVWHRIHPRLEPGRGFDVRRWVIAASVAVLVGGAFLAGRFWPRPDAPVAENPGVVRERLLLVAVGDHLERSQILLIDFVNGGPVTEDLARDLVASNRLYRQAAVGSGETAVASFLGELEPILLELAHNSEDPEDAEIRRRIESKGLVFKVRVVSAGLRERTPGGKKL